MRRKKTFVLLEIIIGFMLVSTLILPFLRYPYQHMRDEIHLLFQMQLTRFAQERLCAIEEELCVKGGESEYVFNPKDKVHTLPPIPQEVELPNGWKRGYTEYLKFECSAERDDPPFHYALVHVYLKYKQEEDVIAEFHTELTLCKKHLDEI